MHFLVVLGGSIIAGFVFSVFLAKTWELVSDKKGKKK